MSDLYTLLPQIDQESGPWVLVTLVETRGSTYRKPGAHLLLNSEGHVGMLSGGCLEAEVASRCLPVLQGEKSSMEMTIDTRRLIGCDGQVVLIAERLPQELPQLVEKACRSRRSATLYTHRPGPDWRPTSATKGRGESYEHLLLPPTRLLVFGSGPGVPPLLKMAHALEWQAHQIVLSSDPAVARHRQDSWKVLSNAKALAQLKVDRRTACVVMNHHLGRDAEVLSELWATSTPYLGLLGSRKRRDEILERLAFRSQQAVDLESRHLYAPVGLDLGAEGAAQIALEICAQIQQVWSKVGQCSGDSSLPRNTGRPVAQARVYASDSAAV